MRGLFMYAASDIGGRELHEVAAMQELWPGKVNKPRVVPVATALEPLGFAPHAGLAAEQPRVFLGVWRHPSPPPGPVTPAP